MREVLKPLTAAAAVAAAVLALILVSGPARADDDEKFASWTEVAEAMGASLDKAYDSYVEGKADEGFDWVNHAYFRYYEKEGFERNVKARVAGRRASQVEYKFATIKKLIRDGAPQEEVRSELDLLAIWLFEDAAKLDGPAAARTKPQAGQAAGETAAASEESSGRDWAIFLAAFFTLLREGFEAILVIAAIAAYLIRSGNAKSVKVVYWASILAIVVSGLAALALQVFFKNFSGAKQEIIEGLTMLLATVVLFSVSNWMYAKAEAEAWKKYITSKIQTAVTTGSAFALALAAFLAVFREGAETILFYQGILSEAGTDTTMVWSGFGVGCVALVGVFIVIRHGSMRLPLKPFFVGTSILMFIMAISFVGGGVKELQEGDAISTTMLEGFPTIDLLGVFPTVQTLAPQAFLLALTIWSIVRIRSKSKRAAA
ncbi:MAG: FTR1 family iron permease [Deltaproteobacteria bacterium]|jgi:high-affinity iron transporter|nr:FTR1 family iron permease [Deltaproteobacteria bacterium]